MIFVATLAEMCQILKIDATTGAKHWRKWPHFFATDGRDARSVRFIPERVIEALAQSNGRLDVQDKGRQAVQGDPLPRRGGRSLTPGLSDKGQGAGLAWGCGQAALPASTAAANRHNLFLGGGSVS